MSQVHNNLWHYITITMEHIWPAVRVQLAHMKIYTTYLPNQFFENYLLKWVWFSSEYVSRRNSLRMGSWNRPCFFLQKMHNYFIKYNFLRCCWHRVLSNRLNWLTPVCGRISTNADLAVLIFSDSHKRWKNIHFLFCGWSPLPDLRRLLLQLFSTDSCLFTNSVGEFESCFGTLQNKKKDECNEAQ